MVEPSVIVALRQAVEADPDNVALRSHWVEVLFRAEEWQQVLDECEHLLARNPRNSDALGYAAAAAEALGRPVQAAGYKSLGDSIESRLAERSAQVPASGSLNERDRVMLADVAGMEEVKRRIEMAVLNPLRNPEITRAYGKRIRGGLLLYGPPGCGKTFLARAIAGQLGSHFVSVGISQILDMYYGQSERNLAEVFRNAVSEWSGSQRTGPRLAASGLVDLRGVLIRLRLRLVSWGCLFAHPCFWPLASEQPPTEGS